MVLKAGDHFRQDERLGQKRIPPEPPATRLNFQGNSHAMIKELAGPVQPQVYMWRSFVHRTTAS
jgi:hypothetical protein